MSLFTGLKVVAKATGKAMHAAKATAKAVAHEAVFAGKKTCKFMSATEELTHGATKAVAEETVTQTASKAASKSAAKTISAEEFALRRTKLVESFGKSGKVEEETADAILYSVKPENIEVFERIVKNPEIEPARLKSVHQLISPENEEVIVDLLKDKKINLSKLSNVDHSEWLTKDSANLYKTLSTVEDIDQDSVRYVLQCVRKPEDLKTMNKLLSHSGVKVEESGVGYITDFFYRTEKYGESIQEARKLINTVTKNKNFKVKSLADFSDILKEVNRENLKFAEKICLREKPLPIKTATSMLRQYNPESEKLLNELLDILPENYAYELPFGLNYEISSKYLNFIKSLNLKSEKEIISVLETLKHIRSEKELEAVMKLMKENPARIKQIADDIIIRNTCLHNADEISEILKKSGRELSPAEIEEFSMYYGCIKQDESREVINKLLADKNIKLEDISRIQYDLLQSRTSQILNSEKKAKFLNRLLDKGLSWEEVEKIYKSADSADKIALIERFIDNPKFLKCNIKALQPGHEAEIERMLQNDIFKPENYDKYIEIINRGEQISTKAGEAKWKQLETLLKSHPDDELGCIRLTKATNGQNKKLVSAMLKREFSLNDICTTIEPYYATGRQPAGLTSKEIDFLTRMYADKEISKEGLRLISQTEPKDLYRIMEKYPSQARQALNAGINVEGMESLLKNKNFDYILTQIRDLEKTHQVKIEYPITISNQFNRNANDLFLTVRTENGALLKFEKTSGKLLTVSQDTLCLNVRNGVKSSTVSYEGKQFEGEFGDITSPYYMETYLERPGESPVKTIYKESSVPGQYEIATQAPDGRKTTVGIAKTMPSGKQYVQRTLKSLDGHTTEFKYKKDPEGNSFLSSKIKTKEGKTISQTTRSIKHISDTHFISSVNGKSYDIEYLPNKVVATKLNEAGKKTAQTVEYAIVDIPENTVQMMMEEFEAEAKVISEQMRRAGIKPNSDNIMKLWQKIFQRHGISPYSIDRKALGLMKQLPGDEWFSMKQSCQYVMGGYKEANNACFAGNPIFMSDELIDNFGVFSHELGHAKFQALRLEEDKELMKIYNREKRLFTQMYPEANIESIDYFLKGNAAGKRGISEGAAETSLTDLTIQSWSPLQDRTILWEQYFPQTSAYIKNKFHTMG